MSRLVVVSNRVALPRRDASGSEGGLAVGLRDALAASGGLWFGWSGAVGEVEPAAPVVHRAGPVTYATLDLPRQDYEEYYNGFANRTLWPLFHYRLGLIDFSRRAMGGYLRVNALFARKLLPLLRDDDIVWVHDYHLIPLGRELRRAGWLGRIGFFLHVPWPALEVLLALPNHRDIVEALCAHDLIGFQTRSDVEAFVHYIRREAEGRVSGDGVIGAFGRRARVGAFPIGIDARAFGELARQAETSASATRLDASLQGASLILGVDRLDYSKGLDQRFTAFEHLLEAYPENRGRVVFLQISPPSREEVPEYQEIRRSLEGMAGRINGTYAEFDWLPVRYLNKGFGRRVLSGFYRLARVGFVTPLRDGMNLVAKEYVAAQDPDDPGVLVLSRFAGAAQELDGALIVNPYDPEGMGDALQRALAMSGEERKGRWSAMMGRLLDHDLAAWRGAFIAALAGIRARP